MRLSLLETEEEREQMYRLVHDEFVNEGYIEARPDGRFVHYAGLLDKIPQTDVFLAWDGSELIGTNSLTRDSDNGLHTQADFPKETMRERLTGKNLVASWRIVTRGGWRSNISLIKNLIGATIERGLALGFETALFTFHPKHMCHYHLMLNMEMIGFSETTDGLHNAPAVCMRLRREDIPERWIKK